ncbi:MAG: hypothetical protein KAH38_10270 [Candidatus Hydrogenedentes bacterium]|nr:hypothetical protein [Candidatus Hydrogenedentota bacterium]
MTMHYIPDGDTGKMFWFRAFNKWLQAHGTAHGFTPAALAKLTAKVAEFDAAMEANMKAKATSKAATAEKNVVRAEITRMARQYAQMLQTSPSVTDEDRGKAGLTIPDRKPTPTDRDAIHVIEPPMLWLDFSIRHQVTVHWGPNPGNERRNARPAGTFGCEIQCARGGIPQDNALWTPIGIETESPFLHVVKDTTPTTYAYRARYIGKVGGYGNFGDEATCTVSV